MPIETIAPEKFEFQDLVCVELALRFEGASGLRLFVEPVRGEDAEIRLPYATEDTRIEVQVKGSAAHVTLEQIALCLAHFPAYTAADCLLHRLLRDEHRTVLLVMSGRCDSSASRYTVQADWSGGPHPQSRIKLPDAKALLREFRKVFSRRGQGPDTPLAKSRRKYAFSLVKEIRPRAFRSALRRLIVLEQTTATELKSQCREHLYKNHRIPGDTVPCAIDSLQNALKIAKNEKQDAIPLLHAALTKLTRQSLAPQDYVPRGDEQAWRTSLSRDGALLLSGPHRCGKSDAARYTASRFQEAGYDVREGCSTEEAERFLLEPASAARLYLLDDPLGSLHSEPNANADLVRLRSLVTRCRPNRKLIVAQNQGQLFATSGSTTLDQCRFGKLHWHDLGTPAAAFLVHAWQQMAAEVSVPQGITEMMTEALANGRGVLELGSLRHLASTWDELPRNPDLPAVMRKAREDASDLGRALAGRGPAMKSLLFALAIASNAHEPIAQAELTFLTDRSTKPRPGLRDSGYAVIVGPSNPRSPTFPAYERSLALSEDVRQALDELERRRFVVARNGAFVFAHPFYRAAAEAALLHPSAMAAEEIMHFFERGLFSLSTVTSGAAAGNAEWLATLLSDSPGTKVALFETLIAGLSSIFPTTRDLCLAVLIQKLQDLPQKFQGQLAHWVRDTLTYSLEYVEWHAGEAWLPNEQVSGFDILDRKFERVKRNAIRDDLARLENSAQPRISPERAVRLLKYFRWNPADLTLAVAARLLSYEDALLRAETARTWLSAERSADDQLLNTIFQDFHPRVLQESYEAILETWPNLRRDRQDLLLARLSHAVSTPAIAAALFLRLIVFNRVEYSGSNPPWEIFGKLLPAVLDVLPLNVHFNEAHLYDVAKEAIGHIAPDVMAALCAKWISWLEREVVSGFPDEYALSVADILLRGTETDHSVRQGLVRRLLSFHDTGALVMFVRDLVEQWEYLAVSERQDLLDLLSETQADHIWLRAVAITRQDVPAELQLAILGGKDALEGAASRLVDAFSPELLSAAVSVFCGNPQPLWWLGTHHSQSAKFEEIVELLCHRPDHLLFPIVLEDFVLRHPDDEIAKIFQDTLPENADWLFDWLLRHKIRTTAFWFPKTWSVLLRSTTGELREQWYDRMAESVPAILDDLQDLKSWLSEETDLENILSRCDADLAAEKLALQLRRSARGQPTQVSPADAIAALGSAIREHPPRLYGTFDHLRDSLKQAKINDAALTAQIQAGREAALEERERIKKKMKFPERRPPHWTTARA